MAVTVPVCFVKTATGEPVCNKISVKEELGPELKCSSSGCNFPRPGSPYLDKFITVCFYYIDHTDDDEGSKPRDGPNVRKRARYVDEFRRGKVCSSLTTWPICHNSYHVPSHPTRQAQVLCQICERFKTIHSPPLSQGTTTPGRVTDVLKFIMAGPAALQCMPCA